MSISNLIREQIIATRPREKSNLAFTNTSSLVETGILDSVGVFTLVAFLEQHFRIEVPDEELAWKNFESIAAITRLVESKLATEGVESR
jgi:acyl carrier protein